MIEQEKSNDFEVWQQKIATYENTFKEWEGRTAKIIERYRDQRSIGQTGGASSRFNILWANVQTLMPAVYARLPKADVSRRFKDVDPVGRVASTILERALDFELDHYSDYRSSMENSVFDRFLGGRGVSWVRYEPHFQQVQGMLEGEEDQAMPHDGLQVTEDADEAETQEQPDEEIEYECCPVDYVHWKDFGHTVARTWEEVHAVWRKVYMTRGALVERFGEELGNQIPMDTKPKEDNEKPITVSSEAYQACIYEIWDKETKSAIWLSKSLGKILDEREDPLDLEQFWPCPRPLFATLTTDSLIPVPDFALYQDQARELDTLCNKIDGLISALQVRGVYDAAVPELARLFTEAGNTELIPVKNWQAFAEKNGLSGAINIVDIAPIAMALNECYKSLDQVKQQIYDIAGIADIMRGASEAYETATAQKIKGQFGSLRLRAMQGKVIQFATELLQLKAQIICKHFQPQSIARIAAVDQLSQQDQQLVPQALELIKNGNLCDFRIEISTDSMVQLDEAQEKSDRMEFLSAVSGFVQNVMPAMQQTPRIAPLMVELLKYGVVGFKVGKTVEGAIDQAIEQLTQQAANPEQKTNPEVEKAQVEAQMQQQALQAKAQADMQIEQFRQQAAEQQAQREFELNQRQAELDAQVEQSKQEAQARQNAHQNELEAQREQMRMQNESMLEQMRIESEAAREQTRQQFDLLIAQMNNANKIEVAEVSKSSQLELAQMAAANEASQNNETRGMQDETMD